MSLDTTPTEAAPAAADAQAAPAASPAPAPTRQEVEAASRNELIEQAKRLLSDEPAQAEAKADTVAKATPERGPDGKFIAKDKPAGEQPAAETPETKAAADKAAAPQDGSAPEDEQPETQAKEPPSQPPAYLPPELRARWDKLDPVARDAIADDALRTRQLISRQGRALSAFEPVQGVITRHQEFLQRHGVQFHEVADNLMEWNARLANPATAADAIRQLAANAKVDLSQFAPRQSAHQPTADDLGLPPDPATVALRDEISQLRSIVEQQQQQLRGVTTHLTAAEQAEMQRQQQEQAYQEQVRMQHVSNVETEIARMQAENADFTELLNSGEIAIEVQKLQVSNPNLSPKDLITRAFDRAVWASDKTRDKAIAARTKATADAAEERARKDKAAAAAAAAKAKSASAINIRGIPNGSANLHNSYEDEKNEILRRHGIMQ